MEKQKQKYVSLLEISKELEIPKTTLDYYRQKGLITKDHTIGKAEAFDREPTIKKIKQIKKYRAEGKLSIDEIKEKL